MSVIGEKTEFCEDMYRVIFDESLTAGRLRFQSLANLERGMFIVVVVFEDSGGVVVSRA